jgi:hypothetical protein
MLKGTYNNRIEFLEMHCAKRIGKSTKGSNLANYDFKLVLVFQRINRVILSRNYSFDQTIEQRPD